MLLFRNNKLLFCACFNEGNNDVMEGDKVMMGDPPSPLPHQENLGYLRVCLVVATRLVSVSH